MQAEIKIHNESTCGIEKIHERLGKDSSFVFHAQFL